MFEKDPEKYNMLNPKQQDMHGDSLFHLVAKMKYNSTVQKATELLCDKKISSNVKNNDDKLPVYYLNTKNDRRLQFFRLANDDRPTKNVSGKSGKMNRAKKSQTEEFMKTKLEGEDLLLYDRRDTSPSVVVKPVVKQPLRKEAVRKRIEELLHNLNDAGYSKYSSRSDDVDNLSKKSKKEKVKSKIENSMVPVPEPYLVKPIVTEEPTLLQQGEEEIFDDEEDSEEEQFKFDPQVFENLEWEVVCTAEVWKAMSNKHVLPEIKQRIVCKIQHLAAGEWTPNLCKKLHHVPDTLRLFEAKITKASRIIWELAVAFSPRLSDSAERIIECNEEQLSDLPVKGGKIYSEIIRVWDIVFDHDKIYSSVQRIAKSHNRGESCIIQKKIKGIKHEKYSNELKKVPRIYAETDIESSILEEIKPFFPPASANETEYHILKFYFFSSNLVSHILQNIEVKVDFPFRVTDLEHAIINIQSDAPILLIGRSGTGKTTCCLYRLWSRFLQYWTKAVEADAPLLPRVMIYKQQEKMQEGEMNTEAIEREIIIKVSGGRKDTSIHAALNIAIAMDTEANDLEVDVENVSRARKIPESCHDEPTASENENETGEHGEAEVEEGQQYDHLHQIFITKNAVLCNEVQKNFRELLHGCDQTKQHVEAEHQNLPNRLQDLNDYRFPLFITSKQLLLMLDASVDQSYFFNRTEDGNLKVDIQGWTDGDGPLSILPLLQEDSDEESDSDEEIEDILEGNQDNQNQGHQNKKKVAPRREMTYELFAETVWPHMNKGVGKKYHPSLVWTEIMSFIKGSYEALSKATGYLSKEEYVDIGRKRAPNFSGEREHIYTLFKQYEHARRQKFLFDETDLVRDVYQRLCKQQNMNWVIHQIFVDETQDFTQAELCLLLRLCQNPNDMFLTGDTAQGIMRGISFRFSDLKSLFFYTSHSLQAMGKTSGVTIPEQVYQLTHNYRSHEGILSLASCILDILVEFFPESFDRLNKDQGLFHGPKPVLLESCSFSDLALLLRGNKRKTSHIEFGAHQAILVVNDAARENVPEELQCGLILTIYEAKGLEFDDILLYNFFRDSKATKEWRVITDFLEKLCSSDKTSTENLVKINSEILEQKDRPRALTFDPNQHKLLNSELKHLYTAVTRARVNVWIFDEDKEKRAPMFEYFKAQHLVKVISIEDAQNLSTSGMFAEESAPEDWIKRAQDFMKNNLYEVAAKSYRQGGDDYMANVAMCHQMALKASRIKENPALMREEFLLAAEQYLEVELPAKAAICLQNAREKELMAYVYDKMGQLDKAAETYRKLKRPIESSACYERLGFFDKAISTLYDHKLFDMANDILTRYKLHIKEFEETGKSISQHLIDHAPGKKHTEEQLAFAAADLYHSTNNIGRMLASLNRLPNIDHRINFLTNLHTTTNNYMSHAAEILMHNGCIKEAAELYLKQGQIRKALFLFRDIEEKDFVGYCQITIATLECTINMDGSGTSEKLDQVKQDLQSAIDLYHNFTGSTCYKFDNPKHGAGEAELLLGQLTDDTKRITTAFANFTFNQRKQYKAGQLECSNWMVHHSDLSNRKNLYRVINAMPDLFEVLEIILTAETLLDREYLKQIFMFYGLETISGTNLVLNPQHKPRILKLVIGRYVSENDLRTAKAEIKTQDATLVIAEHLIRRAKEWFKIIEGEIYKQHRKFAQCPLYTAGLRKNTESDCCDGLHKKITENEFRELIELDQLFMEMEYYVDKGISNLRKKNIRSEIKSLFDEFINNKYCSCKLLVGDLFQHFRHGSGISDTINQAMDLQTTLTEYPNVQMCMKRYFDHEYQFMKEKKNLKRDRNTELFMEMGFLLKLMKLPICISTLVFNFQKDVQEELNKRRLQVSSVNDIGFLINDGGTVYCIVSQFLHAYRKMYSSRNNSREALVLFAKFIQQVRHSNSELILPDLTLLLTWTEFFTTTSLCMESKFSLNPDPWFVVPSSYITLVYFIDSSYMKENGITTFESITRQKYAPESDKIRNRIERFVGMLAGTDNRLNVIRKVFQNLSEAMKEVQTGDDQKEEEIIGVQYTANAINAIGIAERVLVLSLILLANMGMTVYSKSETYVIRELCRIELPLHSPERLVRALEKIKFSSSVLDIVHCLKILIHERDDDILLCRWDQNQNRRYGIVSEPLQEFTMFSSTFSSPETKLVVDNPELVLAQQKTVAEEDIYMVEEQNTDVEAVRKQLEDENKRNKSAVVIAKFFRNILLIRKCKILSDLCEKDQSEERLKDKLGIFADIVVDDKMCGICGEVFQDEQKESSKHASYAEVTRKSIDNSSRHSTFPLETGPLHLIKGMDGHQSEISAATASKEVTELSQKQSHMTLYSHCQKQKQFSFFKEQYVIEIKEDLDVVNMFIEKYELRSTEAKTWYKDFTLKVINVLFCHEELEKIIRKIMETKDWGNTTVLQKSKEMIGNMKEISQWVSAIYSKQSKVSAKQGKLYKTNDHDDYDEDVEDDVVPVVEEPFIRRDGKSKRKRKKNGKHN
ncbi:unnamed protein product [Mytilus coruscus]|uniref:UvrD-like helicase ATP-binding domain-containing protein n=1 Tax=Mytilus coruscus TaxID=42192 RepID=A0A6J8AD87_MYTCO|nr:unnamed protein product [Mytilus coruscus]